MYLRCVCACVLAASLCTSNPLHLCTFLFSLQLCNFHWTRVTMQLVVFWYSTTSLPHWTVVYRCVHSRGLFNLGGRHEFGFKGEMTRLIHSIQTHLLHSAVQWNLPLCVSVFLLAYYYYLALFDAVAKAIGCIDTVAEAIACALNVYTHHSPLGACWFYLKEHDSFCLVVRLGIYWK